MPTEVAISPVKTEHALLRQVFW